jgi:uncharacterized membrane protein YciS (DUF1049 family)
MQVNEFNFDVFDFDVSTILTIAYLIELLITSLFFYMLYASLYVVIKKAVEKANRKTRKTMIDIYEHSRNNSQNIYGGYNQNNFENQV